MEAEISPGNKYQVHIKMLTKIWTGNEERKNDYLRETGLLGSLRWWCEALVRGLGGFACDPTGNGCQYKPDNRDENNRIIPRNEQICPVCELFGCTGWSRKFRLRLLDSDGSLKKISPSTGEFIMEFRWLQEVTKEEIWLLQKSLFIAAEYGSIGGKNVLKPQSKQKVGADYGLIKVGEPDIFCGMGEIKNYIKQYKKGANIHEYPDLRFFFFSKDGYLERNEINEFFNKLSNSDFKDFMQGKEGISKKMFSFAHGGGRIWGYTRSEEELNEAIKVIKDNFNIKQIIKGGEVMV